MSHIHAHVHINHMRKYIHYPKNVSTIMWTNIGKFLKSTITDNLRDWNLILHYVIHNFNPFELS